MDDTQDTLASAEIGGLSSDEKRLPHARWQLVEVNFTAADTDKVIPHLLTPKDANIVKWEVMDRNSPGSIYRGAKAPQTDYIVLRSSVAGSFHIRLYIPAHYEPTATKLPTTSYVPSTAANALLDGVNHSDTLAGAVARGDIIFGNSTPKWARKAVGTGVLAADGTDVTGWTKQPSLEQIVFPATQVSSGGANTLDDYEEGSWTPIIGTDGSDPTGQTYSVQLGRYVKIGVMVQVWFQVAVTNKGTMVGGGNQAMRGLPFVTEGTIHGGGTLGRWSGLTTAYYYVNFDIYPSLSYAYFTGNSAAGDSVFFGTAEITNTTVMVGTMIYRASA